MKKRLILVILILMFSVTGCTEKVREDKKDILEVGQPSKQSFFQKLSENFRIVKLPYRQMKISGL